MSSISHILCPVDFSDTSEVALIYATQLARRLDARVTVLHVYQLMSLIYPDDVLVDPIGSDAAMRAAVEARMTALLAALPKSDLPIGTELREGIPYVEVIEAAKQLGADMIVMGTHGRSGIRRALVGSVTERVLRASSIPVLSVRKP